MRWRVGPAARQPKGPARCRAGNDVGKGSLRSHWIDRPDEGVIDRGGDGWALGRPVRGLRQFDVRALAAQEIGEWLVWWLGHSEKWHVAAAHGVVQRGQTVLVLHVDIEAAVQQFLNDLTVTVATHRVVQR